MWSDCTEINEPWLIDFDLMLIGQPSLEASFLKSLYEYNPGCWSLYSSYQVYPLLGKMVMFTHDFVLRPSKKNPACGRLTIIATYANFGNTTKVSLTKTVGFSSDIWNGVSFVPAKHSRVLKHKTREELTGREEFKKLVNHEGDTSNSAGLKTKLAFFQPEGDTALILQRRAPGITFSELKMRVRKGIHFSVIHYFNIAIESLRELHRLHAEVNILHANINEDNVLVDLTQQRPKVTFVAFRCARQEAEPYPYTGHPAFTPPECSHFWNRSTITQFRNTRASDVFALGRLLHFLAGGALSPSPPHDMIYNMNNLQNATQNDRIQINSMLSWLTHRDPNKRSAPLDMAEKIDTYLKSKLELQLQTYQIPCI